MTLSNLSPSPESRTLTLCRGLQGSGKSTFAELYISESPATRTRINRDNIRFSYFNSYWGPSVDEEAVTAIELNIAAAIMAKAERDIIVDNTNVKESSVLPYLELANRFGYEVVFQDFNVELDELIRRDAARERQVGEAAIRSYHEQFVVEGKLPAVPTLA
jgi:predicted kinase